VRYRAGAGGDLVAAIPDRCPFAAEDDGSCELGRVHERPRKTGPCHPLQVMRCRTHARCFTLYPSGFAPYQRIGVERRGPEGSLLVPDAGADATSLDFSGTIFEAALDGARGQAWRRESSGDGEGWWGTQGRHLQMAGELFGVASSVDTQLRERLGALLEIDTLSLSESSAVWSEGYRSRSRAILGVLARLRRTPGRVLRLLHAGFLAGRWGRPLWWRDGRRIVETLPFQPPGRASPA